MVPASSTDSTRPTAIGKTALLAAALAVRLLWSLSRKKKTA